MNEFDLTLTEVKNKIRIYRTTYGQEVKKMEGNGGIPKLNWFNEMHKAFTQGKIKSFTKSPSVRVKSERKLKGEKLLEIDYEVENDNDQDMSEKSSQELDHQIIIEQYQEADEEDYSDPLMEELENLGPSTSPNNKKFKTESKTSHNIQNQNASNTSLTGVNTFIGSGMVSNELFLKSLQSTLDSLPDQKNMKARIKIQEVLYKIAYDIDD